MPSILHHDFISLHTSPIDHLTFLACGKSGIVYGIDDTRILKEYHDDENDIVVECRAFARLGAHKNIAKCLGFVGEKSIVVERGQLVREALAQTESRTIPLDEKIQWIKDAAEGMRHIHSCGIVHADIGCGNMILVHGHVKIIDFEGSSIDGEEATSGYGPFSYQKSDPPISQQTDIFAFGCAMYEIMTGHVPYHELATTEDPRPRDRVMRLYAQRQFPSVAELPLGDVMLGCWTKSYTSTSMLITALNNASNAITSHYDSTHKLLGFWYRISNFFHTGWSRLLSWRSKLLRYVAMFSFNRG